MQKVEILLEGRDEERCAALINVIAQDVIRQFEVQPVNIFCGRGAVRKGIGELVLPNFMLKRE